MKIRQVVDTDIDNKNILKIIDGPLNRDDLSEFFRIHTVKPRSRLLRASEISKLRVRSSNVSVGPKRAIPRSPIRRHVR